MYKVGDKVLILPKNIEGRIEHIYGSLYAVSYTFKGWAMIVNFFSSEISPIAKRQNHHLTSIFK